MRFLHVCTIVCASLPTSAMATTGILPPTSTAFAYKTSHTALPIPSKLLSSFRNVEGADFIEDFFEPVAITEGQSRVFSRDELCGSAAVVAKANNLPVPFFANLIWQESGFKIRTISRVGAQGIAQFMPRTAVEYGLLNPFDPVHALSVAGQYLRVLHERFGNLGLAAAAYNAGPRRVNDWMANRIGLPKETQNFVVRITGRPAEDWVRAKPHPRDALMPQKAPCVEVAQALREHEATLRVAGLMQDLAVATQVGGEPDAAVKLMIAALEQAQARRKNEARDASASARGFHSHHAWREAVWNARQKRKSNHKPPVPAEERYAVRATEKRSVRSVVKAARRTSVAEGSTRPSGLSRQAWVTARR